MVREDCIYRCRIALLYRFNDVEVRDSRDRDIEEVEDEAIEKVMEQFDPRDYDDIGVQCWIELDTCKKEGGE